MSAIYYSQMKPSLPLTRDTWTVSMVIENKPFSMHTLLLIETIQESGRVNFKAHLMGPSTLRRERVTPINRQDPKTCCSCWGTVGKVDITPLPETINPARYRPQRKTWSVSREKVQAMIDQIRKEKEHPELVDRPFHILGEKSFFARERIEFDIQDQMLLQMREQEPKKFHALYSLYQEWKELEKQYYAVYNMGEPVPRSVFLESPKMIPKKYPVLKASTVLLSPGMRLFLNNEKQTHKIIGGTAYIIGMMPVLGPLGIVACVVDIPRWLQTLNKVKKNEEQINLFDKYVRKTKIVSQNCFNWARSKLTSIDIDVGVRSYERFAVIPTSHLSDQTNASQDRDLGNKG